MQAIEDFEGWRRELLAAGAIVQQGDDSVPAEGAGARFDRYVELVRMVEGDEGVEVAAALVASMGSEEDYGAYQATQGALALFPADHFGCAVATAASALLEMPRDRSGELLLAVARNDASRDGFNSCLTRLDAELRAGLAELVGQEELDGWLSDERLRDRGKPWTMRGRL